MKKILLLILALIATTGCVTKRTYVDGVLTAYKKGLRVGRVIGRDDVLENLESQNCFQQTADQLMREDPSWERMAAETAHQVDQLLQSKRKN